MSPVPAVLVTLLAVGVMAAELYYTHTQVSGLVMLGVCVWVAWDSRARRLTDYDTGLALRPLVLFVLMFFIWPFILPWYLIVRGRIGRGEMPRKTAVGSGPARGAEKVALPCPKCGASELAQGAVIGRYCRVCGWRESRA